VYKIGNTEYDGLVDGVLVEAKGPGYAGFIKDNEFKYWFGRKLQIINQAKRQVAGSGGVPLVWHVADAEFKPVLEKLFMDNDIFGITVVHTAAK
jgi:hypothetical protein